MCVCVCVPDSFIARYIFRITSCCNLRVTSTTDARHAVLSTKCAIGKMLATSFPAGGQNVAICMSVCLSVFLSACISQKPNFTKISVLVACGCGSVPSGRQCNTLYRPTVGFVDDVRLIFT